MPQAAEAMSAPTNSNPTGLARDIYRRGGYRPSAAVSAMVGVGVTGACKMCSRDLARHKTRRKLYGNDRWPKESGELYNTAEPDRPPPVLLLAHRADRIGPCRKRS